MTLVIATHFCPMAAEPLRELGLRVQKPTCVPPPMLSFPSTSSPPVLVTLSTAVGCKNSLLDTGGGESPQPYTGDVGGLASGGQL